MRVWGRISDQDGNKIWIEVDTDPNGYNDRVYLTALAQVLLLNLQESPFYANYGIPAHTSVVTQVFPDFYVAYTQQQYAQYFSSLIVSRRHVPEPTYDINITTNQGAKLNASVPIPV